MTHAERQIQRRQHQNQRQQQEQQQEQQQHPFIAPGDGLPEKQQQTKHNPISANTQLSTENCDQ
jgi:hypothetical protein